MAVHRRAVSDAADFYGVNMRDDARLAFWVIYQRPKDFPEGFVLRCQYAMKDGSITFDPLCIRAKTAEGCRIHLPAGVSRIGPWENDDPVILEVWV